MPNRSIVFHLCGNFVKLMSCAYSIKFLGGAIKSKNNPNLFIKIYKYSSSSFWLIELSKGYVARHLEMRVVLDSKFQIV